MVCILQALLVLALFIFCLGLISALILNRILEKLLTFCQLSLLLIDIFWLFRLRLVIYVVERGTANLLSDLDVIAHSYFLVLLEHAR